MRAMVGEEGADMLRLIPRERPDPVGQEVEAQDIGDRDG